MNNTSWMKIAVVLAVTTLVLGITTAFLYMENVAYYRRIVELEQSYEDLEQLASRLMSYVYSEDGRVAVGYPLDFQEYADSILEICETAIDQYYIVFGMECPDIQFFLTTNTPWVSLGIGAGYRIYLSVRSIDDLRPPDESGYYNIYGVVQSIALTVFMTDNDNFTEGWKIYSASKIVSEIYWELGDDAWPIPYNYSETEGETRLLNIINDPELCKPGTYYAAAKLLYTIESKYGSWVFSQALYNMKPSYTEDRYHLPFYRLEDFKNALIDVTGDPSILDLFSEYWF